MKIKQIFLGAVSILICASTVSCAQHNSRWSSLLPPTSSTPFNENAFLHDLTGNYWNKITPWLGNEGYDEKRDFTPDTYDFNNHIINGGDATDKINNALFSSMFTTKDNLQYFISLETDDDTIKPIKNTYFLTDKIWKYKYRSANFSKLGIGIYDLANNFRKSVLNKEINSLMRTLQTTIDPIEEAYGNHLLFEDSYGIIDDVRPMIGEYDPQIITTFLISKNVFFEFISSSSMDNTYFNHNFQKLYKRHKPRILKFDSNNYHNRSLSDFKYYLNRFLRYSAPNNIDTNLTFDEKTDQ